MKKLIIVSLVFALSMVSFTSAAERPFLKKEIDQVKQFIKWPKSSNTVRIEKKKLINIENKQELSGQKLLLSGQKKTIEKPKLLTWSCKPLTWQQLINQQNKQLKIKQVEDTLYQIIQLATKVNYDTTILKSYKDQLSSIKQSISTCKQTPDTQDKKVDLKPIIDQIKQELQKIKNNKK